jgi:hypothetical protein
MILVLIRINTRYRVLLLSLRILRHKTHPTLRDRKLPYILFRIKYAHISCRSLRRVRDGMGCQADQFLHLTDVACASRKLTEIGLVLWLCFGEACCSHFVSKLLSNRMDELGHAILESR